MGLRTRAEGPRKFLNVESLKCHFLNFGEVLTEFRWSENSVLVCRNLQFAYNLVVLNGELAKAYLINYRPMLGKLQESMDNMIFCLF